MKSQFSQGWPNSRNGATLLPLLAAVFVLMAGSAKSQAQRKPEASKSDQVPSELKLHWRNSSSTGPTSVSVEWDGKALKYERSQLSGVPSQKSAKFSISPSEQAWKEFWSSLDQEEVWKWIGDYGSSRDTTEGYAWSVVIARGAKKVKSSGTNRYPSLGEIAKPTDSAVMFHRLSYAVDRLVASPVEVEGIYLAGFETSRFSPSTQEFKGGMWWLESNQDFNRRYESFLPSDKTKPRLAGPEVFARLRGRLVGPGHYGHLNQYDHEIIVEQVLEMKPLSSR